VNAVNAALASHAGTGKYPSVSAASEKNLSDLVDAFFGAVLIRADNLAPGVRVLAQDEEDKAFEDAGFAVSNGSEAEEIPSLLKSEVNHIDDRPMVRRESNGATGLLV